MSRRAKLNNGCQLASRFSDSQSTSNLEGEWRQEPLTLRNFIASENHLSSDGARSLFPKQEEDLLNFLGSDPKQLFSPHQQTNFSQAFFLWGKGCLGENEKLTDLESGQTLTVKEWAKKGNSLTLPSWDGEGIVYKRTSPVYYKGKDSLYRICLENGSSFTATAKHKCLTDKGFREVGLLAQDIQIGLTPQLFASYPNSKISSIEKAGYGDFYDLTVPETHNYFDSQGICHHNSGKDLCVSYVQAWILHVLLCLNNPQQFLGLAPNESIDIVVIGYNQHQAREVYFTKFINLLDHWQWLRDTINELYPTVGAERWLRRGGEYRGAEKFEAPNKIRCWSLPSTPNSGEGKNIIFFVLDELAAFSSPVKVNQAKAIHDMVVSSARSRFPKGQWKGFAISYPRHKEDYMMRMIRLAESGKATDLYWSRRPTWEVNPRVAREDLETHFQSDPEGSAMRYGCEPPAAIDAFFRSPDEIILHAWGAPEYMVREVLPHASDAEVSAIAHRGQNPLVAIDINGDAKLDHRGFPQLAKWFIPSKSLEYFVHLDPGKSGDAFGFGMGHLQPAGEKELPVLDLLFRWTGTMFSNFGEIYRECYFPDTLEQTETITAAEVNFRTVREFIFFLKFKLGFNIIHCSYDGWNSVEYAQSLRNRDIGCSELVIKKKQYDELKSLIYQRKIKYYGNPVFIRECQKLQILNGEKIDAPRTTEGEGRDPDSHKDIADCAAGLAYRLTRLRESWVEYGQLADSESYLERTPPEQVNLSREQLNKNQSQLFDLFFNE